MKPLPIRTVLAALAVSSITLLAACSNDDSSTASTTSASSPAMSSSTAGDMQPMMDSIPSPFVDAPQLANTYLGSVEGTDAYIAVIMADDKAVAFLCDGSSMWEWPTGSFKDNRVELTNPSGTTVGARLDGSTLTGTVKINGTDHNFSAVPAQSNEGVYRTVVNENGQVSTVGWIIRDAGGRGLERSSTGAISNAVRSDTEDTQDDRRQRERREERDEQRRCDQLVRDLADARATLAALQALPREGGNIQMVVLAQQRVDRLVSAQC